MNKIPVLFEAFCEDCGFRLTRNARIRNNREILVEVCSNCVDEATKELQAKIEQLQRELDELQQLNWNRLTPEEKEQAIKRVMRW